MSDDNWGLISLLVELHRSGIRLRRVGEDTLRATPASSLTPEQSEQLRQLKQPLLDLLADWRIRVFDLEQPTQCLNCGSTYILPGKHWLWCLACETKVGRWEEPDSQERQPQQIEAL